MRVLVLAQYYDPGAGFAAMVWTNNAWLTAVSIGTGISGFLPVYFQASNAIVASAKFVDCSCRTRSAHGLDALAGTPATEAFTLN